MADKIRFSREQSTDARGLVADQDVYETLDGRIVTEDDPEANRLVASAGKLIRQKDVERLGISESRGGKVREAEPVAATPEEPPAARETVRRGSVNLTRTKE